MILFLCAHFWTYRIRLRMDFPVTASVLFDYCCCIAFVTFLVCVFAWIILVSVSLCVYVILCPFHCWWAFEWCVSQGSLEEQTWQDECGLQAGFVTSAYMTLAGWVVQPWLPAGWRGWELGSCLVRLDASAVPGWCWSLERFLKSYWSSVHVSKLKRLGSNASEVWRAAALAGWMHLLERSESVCR